MKNRYRSWLNNLEIDENPNRWCRIKKLVDCINSINENTIVHGRKKTRLIQGHDFDDRINYTYYTVRILEEKFERKMLSKMFE